MKLYNLSIQKITYGEDKDKYNCTAKFNDHYGREVKLVLGQHISDQILKLCRDELVYAANEAASEMINSINGAVLGPPKDPVQTEQSSDDEEIPY